MMLPKIQMVKYTCYGKNKEKVKTQTPVYQMYLQPLPQKVVKNKTTCYYLLCNSQDITLNALQNKLTHLTALKSIASLCSNIFN